MTHEDVIEALEITAKLMELHDENPFKVKAMANGAYKLSKMRYEFEGKSREDIEAIEGIGKGISAKIIELLSTGTTSELRSYIEKTPAGVIEMLGIKGLGPKKIRQLWLDLEIESIGELLYACNENRLITLKGFGEKTQASIKQNIEFNLASKNKFHYASLEKAVENLLHAIKMAQPNIKAVLVGEMARKCEIIDKIEILISEHIQADLSTFEKRVPLPVNYLYCEPSEFEYHTLEKTATSEHLVQINFASVKDKHIQSVADIYKSLNMQFIEPELREGISEVELAKQNKIPALIELKDLKGILHNHTTYSDGVNTLFEMANYCQSLGYEYLGICDHSRSAFYANGLSEERVLLQQLEIEKLNATYTNFKILKGIESDILNDGSLDYSEEILRSFDFVVASVHSNLKMNEQKATQRLISAVENPYTSILGHPTGRLLLSRNGYPIDHKKVIDACAANKVTIELNAHPYRLDIDWRWIPYCIEKGVKIAINPDAHHKEGFHDMHFGVCVARKGMLDKHNCLNALSLDQLLLAFKK